MTFEDRLSDVTAWLSENQRMLVRSGVTLTIAIIAAGIVWVSWRVAGPVSTIVYVILFGAGATLLPGLVVMFRDMLPNLVGRLLFSLGQLATGGSWLVQDGHWHLCPGRTVDGQSQYYHDGEWHEIVDTSATTRLGWADFGITWHKRPDDLASYRVDTTAGESEGDRLFKTPERPSIEEIATNATEIALNGNGENGQKTVSDGGTGLKRPDPGTIPDDVWVLNHRNYWQDRVRGIGDSSILDDVERVVQREEALSKTISQNRVMLATAFSLVLGAATGYVAMVGF